MSAVKTLMNDKHPWTRQLEACLELPVCLSVWDISDALVAAKKTPTTSARKLVDTAAAMAEIYEGIAILDATPALQRMFSVVGSAEFGEKFHQVLRRVSIPQLQDLAANFQKAVTAQGHRQVFEMTVTATNPRSHWNLKVVELQTIANRSFALLLIDDVSSNVEADERAAKNQSVLEHLSDFTGMFSVNGDVEYLNAGAREIIGWPDSDKLPALQDMLSASGLTTFMYACGSMDDSNECWMGDVEVIHRGSGGIVPLQVKVMALRTPRDGKIIGFSMTGKLVAELDSLRREVERRDKLIEDAARLVALGQVAGQVIHEINNPVTVITGKAEKIIHLAKTQNDSRELYVECAEKILKMTQRTEKIIRSVKSLAHKQSSSMKVKVSIRRLMDEVRDLIEVGSRKSSVEVRIPEIPADIQVVADQLKLSQVFVNLFGNSYDAVAKLEERWVEMQMQTDASWVTIRVVDSGKGIPREIAQNLFEGFYTTKPAGAGTGIGLSLSRQIARAIGGDLFLDDTAANTTFVLKLPRVKLSEDDMERTGDWEEI